MDWRKNAGYIITDAILIGESEIVLGVHETQPNMFVTWECSNKNPTRKRNQRLRSGTPEPCCIHNKTSYYWGHYFTDLIAAQKDFCKRGYEKAKFVEKIHAKPKIKEPER